MGDSSSNPVRHPLRPKINNLRAQPNGSFDHLNIAVEARSLKRKFSDDADNGQISTPITNISQTSSTSKKWVSSISFRGVRPSPTAARTIRGVQPTTLRNEMVHKPVPSPLRPHGPKREAFHQFTLNLVNEYISTAGTISINGTRVRTVQEAFDQHLPFFERGTVQAVLRFFAQSGQGRLDPNGKITSGYLFAFFVALCAAWRRHHFDLELVPRDDRLRGMDYCTMLVRELGLCRRVGERAQLSIQSLYALIRATLCPTISWSPRDRLSVLVWMSIEVQTGLRPHSTLHGFDAGDDDTRQGLRYGDFDIWVFPGPSPNDPNALVGHLSPRCAKTKFGKGRHYPLRAGPTIGTSPLTLHLIAMVLDGIINWADFERIFRYDFLIGGQPTLLVIPPQQSVPSSSNR